MRARKNNGYTWACAAGCLLMLLGSVGYGRDGSALPLRPEPSGSNRTVITSDRLRYDYKRQIAVFEGNVLVQDPEVDMRADRLIVVFEHDNNIKSVTASGNVVMWQEDRVGFCEKAIYIALGGEITLYQNARLHRGMDSVRGEKITFWVDQERMICEPGHLTIYAREDGASPLTKREE